MARAVWNGAVLAESNACEIVEGNYYFPPHSVRHEFLHPSQTHTVCPWKGVASYYDIHVNDLINRDAAWFYPEPKPAAARIKNYVAFWKGVTIEPEPKTIAGE